MSKLQFRFVDKKGNIHIIYIDKDEYESLQRFRNNKDYIEMDIKYPLTLDECIEPKSESNE